MKKKEVLILIGLLILTCFLEAGLLTKTSIWHDEAFSVLLPQYSMTEMIYRAGLDVHPPFYYILLKGWFYLLGNSVFSLRLFSLVFGALSVIIFFYLIKMSFGDKKLSLFLSFLFLSNCFFIQYEIEGRMYTLALFLSLTSTLFLIKALKRKRKLDWFLYSLFVALGVYTHYYVLFLVFAQGFFLAIYFLKKSGFSLKGLLSNRDLKDSVFSFLLIGILFLPWLKTFFAQLHQVSQGYWIPKMNIWSVPGTLWKLTTGRGIDINILSSKIILVLLSLLVLFFIFYFLKKTPFFEKYLFLSLFLLPFILSALLSLKRSVYLDRYFIFVLPFFLTIGGTCLWQLNNSWFRKLLIIFVLLASSISFPLYWKKLEVYKKPGMKKAAEYLNQNVKNGQKIYVGSSFVFFTLRYYNKTPVLPKLFAPGPLSHFSGTALLDKKDIVKDLNKGLKKGDIVYLVNTTGFGNYQPPVPQNWKKIEVKGFQDLYDYRGWIIVTKYQVQ
ncbi:MAG TPA: hypothetical protein ENF68_00155 [bacterium]|nr:hypothetical protein [bacterium]